MSKQSYSDLLEHRNQLRDKLSETRDCWHGAVRKIKEQNTVIEQLQQRNAELERENSVLVKKRDDLVKERVTDVEANLSICEHLKNKYKSERDALAAHVGRLESITTSGLANKRGSALDVLNEIGSLLEESPQTSLAEVMAKQAEESYIAGADSFRCLGDGKDARSEAKQHAAKIREGSTNETKKT
tara:strand:- start:14327 stop:14884 length:558 start_codon:yes stop_codon:yes gene_type:complete